MHASIKYKVEDQLLIWITPVLRSPGRIFAIFRCMGIFSIQFYIVAGFSMMIMEQI